MSSLTDEACDVDGARAAQRERHRQGWKPATASGAAAVKRDAADEIDPSDVAGARADLRRRNAQGWKPPAKSGTPAAQPALRFDDNDGDPLEAARAAQRERNERGWRPRQMRLDSDASTNAQSFVFRHG